MLNITPEKGRRQLYCKLLLLITGFMRIKIKHYILFTIISVLAFTSCRTSFETSISTPPNPPNTKHENVVFYIAHQDDDVFISSKISEHLRSNDNVFVVYTCLSFQRGERYEKKRVNEATSAMNALNVPESNIVYLGYPDMESHKHMNNLISATDSLFHELKPDVVYTSAYEGGNIDHDVANYVISQLKYKRGFLFEAFEFPEYSGYNTNMKFKYRNFPDEPTTYVKKLSDEEYAVVSQHWDFYRSQKFPINFLMAFTIGKRNIFGYEYYRPLPRYDYSKKPPTGSIAYEKYLDATFDDFIMETQSIPEVEEISTIVLPMPLMEEPGN